MKLVRSVLSTGWHLRFVRVPKQYKTLYNIRHPVTSLRIISRDQQLYDNLAPYLDIIQEQINVESLQFSYQFDKYLKPQYLPVHKQLGKRLGKDYNKDLIKEIKAMTVEQGQQLKAQGRVVIAGVEVFENEVETKMVFDKECLKEYEVGRFATIGCICIMDLRQTDQMNLKAYSRVVTNRLANVKKWSRVTQHNQPLATLFYKCSPQINKGVDKYIADMRFRLRSPLLHKSYGPNITFQSMIEQIYGKNGSVRAYIKMDPVFFDERYLAFDFQGMERAMDTVRHLQTMTSKKMSNKSKNGVYELVSLDGKVTILKEGRHYHLTKEAAIQAKKHQIPILGFS